MNQLPNQLIKCCLIIGAITFLPYIGYAQAYDTSKISNDSVLNFAQTEMRGIKSKTGIIYFVQSDNQILTAINPNGSVIWEVNVVKHCGEHGVGKSEIRWMKLVDKKIQLVYGKHDYANVSVNTGEIHCIGAD